MSWEARAVLTDPDGGTHRVAARGETREEAVGRLRWLIAFMLPWVSTEALDAALTVNYCQ